MIESSSFDSHSLSIMPGVPPAYNMPPPSTTQRRVTDNRLYPTLSFQQASICIDPSLTDGSSNYNPLASSSSPHDLSSRSSLSPNAFSTDFDTSDFHNYGERSPEWELNTLVNLDGKPVTSVDPSSLHQSSSKGQTPLSEDSSKSKPIVKAEKKTVKRASNSWMIFRSEVVNALKAGGNEQIIAAAKEMRRLQAQFFADHPGQSDQETNDDGQGEVDGDGEDDQLEASGSKGKARGKFGGTITVNGKKFTLPSAEFLTTILDALEKGESTSKLAQMDLSRFFSFQWSVLMTEEEKQVFYKMADVAKEEHKAAHPDYKYVPRRKSDKLREAEIKRQQKAEARWEKDQAKKQSKREKQSAGRATRRQRTRTRHSPISPSNGSQATAHPDSSFNRSLSFSSASGPSIERWGRPLGLDADSFFRATDSGYMPEPYSVPTNPARLNYPSSVDLSALAFPLPAGALPSMTTNEERRPFEQNLLSSDSRYSLLAQPMGAYPIPSFQPQRPYPSYEQPQSYTSSINLISPLDSTYLLDQTMSQPDLLPKLQMVDDFGFGSFSSATGISNFDPSIPWNSQSEMPYDLFQLSGSSEPSVGPASTTFSNDGFELNSLSVPENIEPFDVDVSSQDAVFEQFNTWVEDQGQSSSVEIRGTSSTTAQNTNAPSTPALELAESMIARAPGEPSQANLDPFSSLFVEEISDENVQDDSFPPFPVGTKYDQGLSFLTMGDGASYVPSENETQDTQSTLHFDDGPFLSIAQPSSPSGSWSTGLTPLEATFLRAGNGNGNGFQNRLPSSSSESGTIRTASSAHSAPRYISASTFPRTPESDNVISNGNGSNNITSNSNRGLLQGRRGSGGDRTFSTSIASLASVFGADVMQGTDDIFAFEASPGDTMTLNHEVKIEEDSNNDSIGRERAVSTQSSAASVQVSLDDRNEANATESISTNGGTTTMGEGVSRNTRRKPITAMQMPSGPVLRRGAPRGRTVAAKY